MTLEMQVMAWDRHKDVAESNRLMGSQSSTFDNWVSNGNTYINKRKKTADSLPKYRILSQKIKDNTNMDCTKAELMNVN
jgi:hypothetical protein